MSAIHWLNAISGSFTNAADWNGGVVPGAADDALLDAVGASPYTVTASTGVTVQSLQLDSEATLSVTASAFTATLGTGSGGNTGVILVGAGASVTVGGIMDNSGTISLHGMTGKARTSALLFNANTTLTGGGEVLLNGRAGDVIGSNLPKGRRHHYAIVYNADNTIAGAGTIGDTQLLMINEQAGTIDASGSTALVIAGNCNNRGLLEATGSGGLDISGSFASGAGVILAGAGSTIRVHGSTLEGGTLTSVGSGTVIAYQATLDNNLVNDANLVMEGGYLAATVTNNGTISVTNSGFAVRGSTTLQGTGVISLARGFVNVPSEEGTSTLTLASGTIEGWGYIGDSQFQNLALTIGSVGLIDGNSASLLGIGTNALVIANAGTIESTGAGGVTVDSPVANTGVLTATAGVLSIGRATAPQSIVNTGTLSVSGGGTLIAYGSVTGKGVARIGGGALEFLSTFNEAVRFTGSTGLLELAASQGFTKTVSGFSKNGKTNLDLGDIGFVSASEASFSGTATSGVLTVTDGTHTAHITLAGDYLASTFVASSDGHGGTLVATQKAAAVIPPHQFVSAIAAFGGAAGEAISFEDRRSLRQPLLLSPRSAAA